LTKLINQRELKIHHGETKNGRIAFYKGIDVMRRDELRIMERIAHPRGHQSGIIDESWDSFLSRKMKHGVGLSSSCVEILFARHLISATWFILLVLACRSSSFVKKV